jgi:hypothetical protein
MWNVMFAESQALENRASCVRKRMGWAAKGGANWERSKGSFFWREGEELGT